MHSGEGAGRTWSALPRGGEPADDDRLWSSVRDDDPAAFTELYHRYADPVWRQAYRLTGAPGAAEDVLAATFLTAWRRRHDLDLRTGSTLAWLLAVAGNEARNEHRRGRRFQRLALRIGAAPAVRDHSDDVVSSLDDRRRLRRVRDALDHLPAAQRTAVELCLIGEVPQAEAARLLDVPEATLRSRIHRARMRLRTLLPEEETR